MIRNATPDDFPAILALNAESVHFLSPLDAVRLRLLHAQAAYHRVVEHEQKVAAFLLAFRQGADYDSPNYRWFAQHYARFLYIDRIVVDASARGLGFGAQLYEDILMFAAATNAARLTAEFDVEPPNPVSAAFHQRFGFREVGTQWIGGDKKQVSLQAREVDVLATRSGMIAPP
ncbi:MAG TPA: GNAT family N-acetyltransferase [Rudaea sp.]|jgi:predicted GNAT superfamily acetyltransferase|nr:GNAT family N-acetyltransferase [Rudaea sp.]